MTTGPYQHSNPEFLNRAVKDFDLLERMHKQEPWTDDQERHFTAGLEAAMDYYRPWFKKRMVKKGAK